MTHSNLQHDTSSQPDQTFSFLWVLCPLRPCKGCPGCCAPMGLARDAEGAVPSGALQGMPRVLCPLGPREGCQLVTDAAVLWNLAFKSGYSKCSLFFSLFFKWCSLCMFMCETSLVDKRVSPPKKFCHTVVLVSGQEHATTASAYKIKNVALLFVMWVSFMICVFARYLKSV